MKKKGTALVGSSLNYLDDARLQAMINDRHIRLSQSAFIRKAIQVMLELTPERFEELVIKQGVKAAAAMLAGDSSTVSSPKTAGAGNKRKAEAACSA